MTQHQQSQQSGHFSGKNVIRDIWQYSKNAILLGNRDLSKEELIGQIQCPHDLGGCGRYMDKRSGTHIYIDPQTGLRLYKPDEIWPVLAFVSSVTLLVAVVIVYLIFPVLFNGRNFLTTVVFFVLLLGLLFLILVGWLIFYEREKVLSQTDHIEIYHCPNPTCGLRSKFRNGKPVVQ